MKMRKKKIKIRDGKTAQPDDATAAAAGETAAGNEGAVGLTSRLENEESISPGASGEQPDSARESGGEGQGPSDRAASLETRVAELEDSLLRAKADFQNLQRRAAVERAEAVRYGNAELMRSLLGAIDDFERSLAAAESSENHESVIEGVRLVHANLVKALNDHGLETIEALHEPFDPNIHEALMRQPSQEHEPGTVVEQIAKGYRLRDRVVRPAKVIVAAAPDTATTKTGHESPSGSESEADASG